MMNTMRVVGECFFWYQLTRVFPDKFHRAVKRLCCVCVMVYSSRVLLFPVVMCQKCNSDISCIFMHKLVIIVFCLIFYHSRRWDQIMLCGITFQNVTNYHTICESYTGPIQSFDLCSILSYS